MTAPRLGGESAQICAVPDDEEAGVADLTPERLSAIRYIDMDGNPLSLPEWGALYEDFCARVIALHPIPGTPGAYMITVLVGYNEPAFGAYPFGTAIRRGEAVTEIAQYSSKVHAQEGHAAFLQWLADNDVDTYTDAVRRQVAPHSHPPQ